MPKFINLKKIQIIINKILKKKISNKDNLNNYLDSIQMLDLITSLEKNFKMKIKEKYITEKNFKNEINIKTLIEKIMNEKKY